MKATQIPITSGPAGGTMVTRVESNSGKLLGFIRVVAVEFPCLGCSTMFISQQIGRNFSSKLCYTLCDAYLFLGVSSKELDKSELGEYCFEEHTPARYWRKQVKVSL